ncbi:MAG: S41 family peptidase, partial [Chitinophagaceae bacterium]
FQLNTSAFTDSVSTIFRELQAKNIHQLIIDLRQNGGGNNENVSTLFSFIARSSFRHLRQAEMLGKTLTWSSYISNATGIDRYPRTHPNGDRYLVNDSYSGTRLSHPRDSFHFAGDVVLLTSGATVSAASEFVAVFHDQQRGKIVGEETGGCYYGSTGGNYLQLRLPNSGLEIRIPTIRIFTAVEEDYVKQPKGRGTFPDYTIVPTVEDVMAGKDVQLEKAMELLR